jgi:hypothetical protein
MSPGDIKAKSVVASAAKQFRAPISVLQLDCFAAQ